MSVVSRDVFCRRTARLHAFVDEVRRYIYNECLNHTIPVVAVDCFCHEMFNCMVRTSGDYSFLELLHMLQSDVFLTEAFARYKSATFN